MKNDAKTDRNVETRVTSKNIEKDFAADLSKLGTSDSKKTLEKRRTSNEHFVNSMFKGTKE